MNELSAQAQEARRDYKRRYRIRNREKINLQQRMWRKKNPDKVKEYQAQYWERKAGKAGNIRASWKDYGITQERVDELVEIVRSGEYDDVVRSAAHMADEKAAEHIILSVKKNLSYERLEYHDKLGRCPLGRTDFYGARRLFFHYLDCVLKNN
ncbi:MAG: hypothetical protein HDR13_10910 [Lachnospiraceae bacterium]|nr:hypothetical protein [Lachnospiraceae bacterium]